MAKAKTVAEVVAAEAGGKTDKERRDSMLDVYSAIVNRSEQLGVSVEDVVQVQSEFNAYNKPMPPGTKDLVNMARDVMVEVEEMGPVHKGTFYATPETVSNLPKGLQQVSSLSSVHTVFDDPQNRSIRTAQGFKQPVDPQQMAYETGQIAVPTLRPNYTPARDAVEPDLPQAKSGLIGGYKGVNDDMQGILDRYSVLSSTPTRLNSGYRSPAHNAKIGGAKQSLHVSGKAADISLRGMTPQQKADAVFNARLAGATRIGAYTPGNAIHIDVGDPNRFGKDRTINGWYGMFDRSALNDPLGRAKKAGQDWFVEGMTRAFPSPTLRPDYTPDKKSYAPTVRDMHPTDVATPQVALTPENIIGSYQRQQAQTKSAQTPDIARMAEQYSQYQSPPSLSESMIKDFVDPAPSKSKMVENYSQYQSPATSRQTGLSYDHGIPSLSQTQDRHREQRDLAQQGVVTGKSYAPTTPDRHPSAPMIDATPPGVDVAKMAEQYGMYKNPDAKPYYDPIDAIPAVIGPNPKTLDHVKVADIQKDPVTKENVVKEKDPIITLDKEREKTWTRQKTPARQPFQPHTRINPGSLIGRAPGLLSGVARTGTGLLGDIMSKVSAGHILGERGVFDPVAARGIAGNKIAIGGRGSLTTGFDKAKYSNPGLIGGKPTAGVYGGPSANFPGMDAHVNDYGVTTVSDDNMSFIDNSSNDGGDTKVLCTHYYDKGWLPADVYFSDAVYAMGVPDEVRSGYHRWAKPLVKIIENNARLERIVWPFVKVWAYSMHHPKTAWSKAIRWAGESICGKISPAMPKKFWL